MQNMEHTSSSKLYFFFHFFYACTPDVHVPMKILFLVVSIYFFFVPFALCDVQWDGFYEYSLFASCVKGHSK